MAALDQQSASVGVDAVFAASLNLYIKENAIVRTHNLPYPGEVQKTSVPQEVEKSALTQPLSKDERRRRNDAKAAPVLELLASRYPHLFTPGDFKPLRVGIFYDLNRDRKLGHLAVTVEPLRLALAQWSNEVGYLKAIAEGGQRYDLDGKATGEVTEEHRKRAAGMLKKAVRRLASRSENVVPNDVAADQKN